MEGGKTARLQSSCAHDSWVNLGEYPDSANDVILYMTFVLLHTRATD